MSIRYLSICSYLPVLALFGGVVAALVLTCPLPGQSSDIQLKGFKIVEENGPSPWKIQASEAAVQNETLVDLVDIRAQMLEGTVEKVWASGDTGAYNTDTRVLDLAGDARAGTVSGLNFNAPTLRWDGNSSNITSHGGVRVTASWLFVKGTTLVYNASTGTTLVTGDVRARWLLDGRNP